MTLGNKIAYYRKNLNITQDALAQQLGVTNQAVSKWESDQCCPDVMLLPKLADLFGTTLDALFGRESQPAELQSVAEKDFGASPEATAAAPAPTWPDDDTLRVVAYIGHRVVTNQAACEKLVFRYEGPALNVESRISIACGNVEGNVDAGTSVCCGNVGGDVDAGTSVSCGNVEGSVDAGTHVGCGQVGGDVSAGTNVKCGDVSGDVDVGGSVECCNVAGDIDAGGSVTIRK